MMIQQDSEGRSVVMLRDRKRTSCALRGLFADREHSRPLVEPSDERSEMSVIQEAESDNDQASTHDSISVPEGPDLSMIPDVCPSSLSMPSTARSTHSEGDRSLSMNPSDPESEDFEPSADEDTQPQEGSQRESASDSGSEAHDDASVGNGTIETVENIELEERSSIRSSHESGETWQPSFSDYSWL